MSRAQCIGIVRGSTRLRHLPLYVKEDAPTGVA